MKMEQSRRHGYEPTAVGKGITVIVPPVGKELVVHFVRLALS